MRLAFCWPSGPWAELSNNSYTDRRVFRIYKGTPDGFAKRASSIVALGTGTLLSKWYPGFRETIVARVAPHQIGNPLLVILAPPRGDWQFAVPRVMGAIEMIDLLM